MITHYNHLFRLSRIRGERETSDRDSSSSRPSLTPHSDHSNWTQSQWFQNWTQSLTIQNWTQFLGQLFQTGIGTGSVTVISNRNHTLTPPRQSLWQLFQSPDGTISKQNNQQMKKGSGSETPSQTHPPWWRFVKMPQEHDRNFIYMTFPGWSKWLSENQSFFGAPTKVGLCLNFQGGWFHFYQTQSI